ncbi:MAG: glycosyltransferase family 9 protein, partial [Bacteriovoracaceae bacterium]|nr:glycosyltransferase family 9 protein [Bacteriovoracaceae bacterium]
MQKNKVLIIRFSSFGDILQGLTVPRIIKQNYSDSCVHWLTRSDFTSLVQINEDIDRVISFDRKAGFIGLIRLALILRRENYTHIYDAHNNVRSGIVNFILRFPFVFISPKFIQRSKDRLKRILLFKFGQNFFPKPFKGRVSFENPLKKWGLKFEEGLTTVQFQFDSKT